MKVPEKMGVYFALCRYTNLIKIGRSANMAQRIEDIKDLYNLEIVPVGYIETREAKDLEQVLHSAFSEYRNSYPYILNKFEPRGGLSWWRPEGFTEWFTVCREIRSMIACMEAGGCGDLAALNEDRSKFWLVPRCSVVWVDPGNCHRLPDPDQDVRLNLGVIFA